MSDSIRAIPHNETSRLDSNIFLQTASEFHPLATSERYYPFAEAATNALRNPTTKPIFTLEMPKPTSGSQSAGSSVGAPTSDPMTPYSTGLTPPSVMKPNKAQNERSLPQIPMSTSPEQYKHTHRSSSSLASAFTSMVRPFSFSTPDSSSPPIACSRKRSSPAASYRSAVTSNSAWPHTDQSGKAIASNFSSKNPSSSSPIYDGRGFTSRKQSIFQTKLKNQDQFHNDGYALESLLDPAKEELYAAYRSIYTRMLFAWELPVARSEVLHYAYVKVQPPEVTDEGTPLISATNILTNEQEELGWDDVTEESKPADDEAWNEVAYKSLMRNLGAKTLTPKPSQIWRGGETRKASLSGVPDIKRSGFG
ncbi:MAG: hypothetical protein Q9209_004887 [Squamulea sp. 1 TL-2023]